MMKSATSTEEISRLCELPNEVVHKILGLLPIREAVRSCVLSKRWKHLWRSMPFLIFRIKDHHYIKRSSSFNKLVHRVCTLRDPSYPIQRLELHSEIRSKSSADLINDSIENAVIKGGVQYLFIYLYSYRIYSPYAPLPCRIFSSQTLVHCHLYLDMDIKPIPIVLPDRISLPRLKVLYLNRIMFSNSPTSIQQLFSCPLLEELDMISCFWDLSHWPDSDTITISPPNLKRMSLENNNLLSSMRMHCESLKEFNYIGKLCQSQKLHISGIKQLEHAQVIYIETTFVNHSCMLLNCLSTTKRLTLWIDHLKRIDLSRQLLEELSQFDNLIELNLQGSTTLPKMVHAMFRKFPYLQILRMENWALKESAGGVETYDDDKLIDPIIPLHHLKKIIVTCTELRCIDIHLMAMLLMSSTVLGELVLVTRRRRSNDDDRVLHILRGLPKVSKDCRISHISE